MTRRLAAALSVLVLTGCGSPSASDSSVKEHLLRGIEQIRGTHDNRKLHGELARILESLRRDRASTAAERKAKRLAIAGFAWTLKGIESELDFAEKDSGNVEAATRDAKRSYRSLSRGARLLRAAGDVFDIRLGRLNGL